MRNDTQHVRVRIGSGALTNTQTALSHESSQSQASSEPMLFDQEVQDAERRRKREFPDLTEAWHHGGAASLQEGSVASLPEKRACWELTRDHDADSRAPSLPHANPVHKQTLYPDSSAVWETAQASKDPAPEYPALPFFQGVEEPLRLIFEDTLPSVNALSSAAMSHIRNKPNAVEETIAAEAAQTAGICHGDHEQPWKSFLAISSRSSSDSTASCAAIDGARQCLPALRNCEAIATWSQQATRGGQTPVSASSVSASLPCLRQPVSARPSGVKPDRQGDRRTRKQDVDEDERLWQAFVFGGEPDFWSERIHEHAQHVERGKSTRLGDSCRDTPLSVAVSSVSPTPLSVVPRPASGKVEGGRSGGRVLCSPDLLLLTDEEVRDEERGGRMAGGEPSVTHASMQKHASLDTDHISSQVLRKSITSRSSVGRSDDTRFAFCGWAGANGPVSQRCSSGYGIQGVSSEGVDVVDRNRP